MTNFLLLAWIHYHREFLRGPNGWQSHALGNQWMENQGPVSRRPTTIKWWQSSQSNRHSTIGTRQTEYHEALPSSANDEIRCDCMFADDGNASWYSVCRVPMVEWLLDCEDCCHLTVVNLHDPGPRLHESRYSKLLQGKTKVQHHSSETPPTHTVSTEPGIAQEKKRRGNI